MSKVTYSSQEEEIIKIIEDKMDFDLGVGSHYRDQKNWLNDFTKAGYSYQDITSKYPNIKTYFNRKMIKEVISDFGDQDFLDRYTFSKELPNSLIFEKLDEMKNAQLKLDELKTDSTIVNIHRDLDLGEENIGKITEEIDTIERKILKERNRFDADSEYTVFSLLDPVIQAAAGWTDAFRESDSMTKIDLGMFDYSPEYGMFGATHESTYIAPLAESLPELYDRKRVLEFETPGKYSGLSYDEGFQELEKIREFESTYKDSKELIESTGLDEVLEILDYETTTKEDLAKIITGIQF